MKAISELSDKDIAFELAKEFDERLFNEIYRRYNRRIYLWCYNYTHDVEEAVELTQEVFVKIYRKVSTYRGASSFLTWVYSVMRNHCIEEVSKKKREWARRLEPIEDDCYRADDGDDYLLIETAQDIERLVKAARVVMKEDELDAFILHYRDGLTVNEITKILGCRNTSGARTLIQGARRKFKKLLNNL